MLGQLECDCVTISVYYTYDIILQITYSTWLSETNVVMKVKQKRFLILVLLHPLSPMLFLLSVIPTITSNYLPFNSECTNIIPELNKNKQEKKMEKRKVETKKTKPKSKKKREGRLTRD